MHHVYTRRIVIALVAFFALLAILFGPLVTALRSMSGAPTSAGGAAGGEVVFNDYCASCHDPEGFTARLADSLDPDSVSQAQLEKLIGPPAHGGVSPEEAVAVVAYLRAQAGLPAEYVQGAPTPAAAATAAAAAPTATLIPAGDIATADSAAVWEQNCAGCHSVGKFAEGLAATDDPDQATEQAIAFLTDPKPHRGLPVEAFGPAMNYIREQAGLPSMTFPAATVEGAGSETEVVVLPGGRAVFDEYCAACHEADKFARRLGDSLDPDAVSQGQLEKLIGPPPHGGVSPSQAVAVVIYLRRLAGLPGAYAEGAPTPAAAATAAAALPTATPIPAADAATADPAAVWEQNCAGCHSATKFAEGLAAMDDPDQATEQALSFLTDPKPHRNRPVEVFAPAMNYIRELAGLPPLQ